MQFSSAKPARGIVYDSAFGETIDTVLALALLHGCEAKQNCRIISLTSSIGNLGSAQLIDSVEKFYASATTGQLAAFLPPTNVGLALTAKQPRNNQLTAATLEKYPPRIHQLNQTAIAEVLIRNALTAQYDGNASIVMAGPPTNLLKLLALRDTEELIKAKVATLVIADEGQDYRPLLSLWPTPIVVVNAKLLYPASSIEKDYAYTPNHPVADAYRAALPNATDAPATAMAAAFYAARPTSDLFRLSEPNGKARKLIPDPDKTAEMLQAITELASAKPVPRIRRPAKVADDAEKAEAKD